MFKKLFVSCTTACFEFANTNPYRHPDGKYTIFVNGVKAGEADTNVFSVYNLEPATEYAITVSNDEHTVRIKTEAQSAEVDVRALGAKGDGKSDDTYFVQMAITSCPAGGRVVIPAGTYLTRPITL